MSRTLLFVYNADSGLFNAMADAAHKLLSPNTYSCSLCKVTYGLFTERRAWRAFVEGLDVPCTFLHRDELHQRYPDLDIPLPAVLATDGETPRVCIDAARLNRCGSIEALIDLVRTGCIDSDAGTGSGRTCNIRISLRRFGCFPLSSSDAQQGRQPDAERRRRGSQEDGGLPSNLQVAEHPAKAVS